MKRSNSTTERLFANAGISEGMRVLELGCGPGEVTEALARLVGPGGSVLAVDRSEQMLASAEARLDGVESVRFALADLNGAPDYLADFEQPRFDAIAGRRVLMYLTEPGKVLADLRPWLEPGGLAVFEEADSTMCPGRVGELPAHDEAMALLGKMLDGEGVDRSMGFRLPATLVDAGLEFERIWAEAVIEGQGDQYTLGELLGLLIPRLESTGVATASEVESLVARINEEVDPSRVFVSSLRFCARARNP